MRGINERLVRKVLVSQALVSVALAAALWWLGPVHGYSGLIALAANGTFAFWVFRPYGAQHSDKLVSRFYGAELLKMAIIAVAFLGVFVWVKPLSAGALFGCFLAVHLVPAVLAAFTRGASGKG